MRQNRVWKKAVFLAVIGLTLGACGGSGSSRSIPVTPSVSAPPPEPTEQPPLNGNPDDFKTTEYSRSWGLEAINAATAYAKGYNGEGVTIGVVDFNFDFTSNELNFHSASRGENTDLKAIYEAQFGIEATTRPHGQAVAVTAAGIKNDTDTHGVAYEAEVIAVDFFSGVNGFQTTQDDVLINVSNPYTYAFQNGARVINKSLGFDEDDTVSNPPQVDERYALEFETTAIELGALIVTSAGNNSDPDPSLSNLEALDRLKTAGILDDGPGALIIVGAIDENLEITPWSDKAGSGDARFHYLVAPGDRVTVPWETEEEGAGLFFISGTSFSAPHVTGAAALVLDRWPSLTAREVANILFDTATDLGEAGIDSVYGQGLLNLDAALQPIGQAKIAVKAGSKLVSDSAVILGPAFGDASNLQNKLGSIMILDSYGRDFQMDASSLISGEKRSGRLQDQINLRRKWRSSELTIADKNLGYSISAERDFIPPLALTGQAAHGFTPDIEASFEFTGRYGHTEWALGTGRSLTDALQRSPFNDHTTGTQSLIGAKGSALPIKAGTYITLGQPVGKKSMVWMGASVAEQQGNEGHTIQALQRDSNMQLLGLRFEHFREKSTFALEGGLLNEEDSILGSRSAGGFKLAGGAKTVWSEFSGALFLSDNFSGSFRAMASHTRIDGTTESLFSGMGPIWSSSFTASLTGQSLFRENDQLILTIHQPLRVEGATAALSTGQNLDVNGNVNFTQEQISLTPSSREVAMELAYQTNIKGWNLGANAGYRLNANHTYGTHDTLILIGISRNF